MNAHDQLDNIVSNGDPITIGHAIDWGMRDPNLRAEIERAMDLLIAQKGHCHSEATAAADGMLAVIRGYLEFQQRSEAA
ncbi:hypothetical protein DFO67_10451 [Modicisalibacter xianhensis]|uniref:Uncharacterized protein n=1 Tax=Modicisalibacter xianhensis TaxID=442341 RepID=A0A4R8G2I2_9GAMM|nr:hypothetical protein [Halomonas xianhensis]TDX30796.1 hypothetical protein DFO67_10451 [Halomonas xianhensis]